MAKVDNATTSTITGLKWTKVEAENNIIGKGKIFIHLISMQISQQGIVDSSKVANAGGWSSPLPDGIYHFTIPSSVPAGQYLLRVETIGLHVASTYPGAQFVSVFFYG